MKKISTLIIFCGITLSVNAQANIDSLRKVWNDATQVDTVRLYAIDELAWDARYKNTDSSILLANFELEYAKGKNLKWWQANACNLLGVAYYIKSNYTKAIEWHWLTIILALFITTWEIQQRPSSIIRKVLI